MAEQAAVTVPLILWHPDGNAVALAGEQWPSLTVRRGDDLVPALQAASGLEGWILHSGGLETGQTGPVRAQALGADLQGGLNWAWGRKPVPPLARAQAK